MSQEPTAHPFTASDLLDAILALDALPVPYPRTIYAPRWFVTVCAQVLGARIVRHRRARGVRGRKRALYSAWRPVATAVSPLDRPASIASSEARGMVDTWRAQNPEIVALWKAHSFDARATPAATEDPQS